MKKLVVLMMAAILTLSTVAYGDSVDNVVVSLGADITSGQKSEMLKKFGVDSSVKTVTVTNEEEHKYLGGYVSKSLIGSKAISCSYVEEIGDGSGLDVEVSNVSWVTEDMIKNALTTAGIKDAKVKVSAPFRVSGTAALTGIIKAFEGATGDILTEAQKQIANEELAKTGELGQEIGKDEATELIKEVKIEVIDKGITNPEEIRTIVEEKAKELNITLNEAQFNKIVSLMENITKLDLDTSEIKKQIGSFVSKAKEAINTEKGKGLVNSIKGFFSSLSEKIKGLF